ncbi:CLUMA_CG003180, isoform A [Clunio marinus]|uniref:CLUMA_CG003180, isoform A n=1 Tax=Clunio marinus TaxID=568069 RepID=A0A1J1HN03_9DIPT|nr:CLUMA_CG003180, isoform A [Clunio marinus]
MNSLFAIGMKMTFSVGNSKKENFPRINEQKALLCFDVLFLFSMKDESKKSVCILLQNKSHRHSIFLWMKFTFIESDEVKITTTVTCSDETLLIEDKEKKENFVIY